MFFKKINVEAYQIGIVYQNGKVAELLDAGSYWVGFGRKITCIDLSVPISGSLALNKLLEFPGINEMLDVVDIKDNELGFEFKDGVFARVLAPGRYAYWKSIVKYEVRIEDTESGQVADTFPRKLLTNRAIVSYLKVFVVQSYEKGLLMINSEFKGNVDPGTYYFWNSSKTVNILKADLRTQQMEVSGQEILTKDKVALRVNFDVQFKIVDIEKALSETNNLVKQMYTTFQLALREYIGTMVLDNILGNREAISPFIKEAVEDKMETFGVEIISCGIRDIILPGDVKEIINQVLIAQKKAQANNIMRQEETASTRSLLNTAKLMEQNEMLFKLKEMEYVEKIASKIGEISVSGNAKVMDQLKKIIN